LPVRVRLGQNWYKYGTLEHIDGDVLSYETRVRQLEKQLAMAARNLAALRDGRDRLAVQVESLQAQHNTRRRAARADKRRTEAEEGDDGL
jgi:chromosome segregation ATPase